MDDENFSGYDDALLSSTQYGDESTPGAYETMLNMSKWILPAIILAGGDDLRLVVLIVVLFRLGHPFLGCTWQELGKKPLRHTHLEVHLAQVHLIDLLFRVPVDQSTVYQSVCPLCHGPRWGHLLGIADGAAIPVVFPIMVEMNVLFNVISRIECVHFLVDQVVESIRCLTFVECQ